MKDRMEWRKPRGAGVSETAFIRRTEQFLSGEPPWIRLFSTGKFVKFALASHLVLSELVLGGLLSLALSPQLLQVCLGALQGVLFHFVFWLIAFECGLFDRWMAEQSEFIWVVFGGKPEVCGHDSRRISGCLHWQETQYEVTLTFMYLTSISVFLSSSTITSLWNFLNYQRTKNKNKNKLNLLHITHPATHSWVTWLHSIRKEWSARMLDNGFLKG